jgi:hypothetical protein
LFNVFLAKRALHNCSITLLDVLLETLIVEIVTALKTDNLGLGVFIEIAHADDALFVLELFWVEDDTLQRANKTFSLLAVGWSVLHLVNNS